MIREQTSGSIYYHYTTVPATLGIIQSRHLWFTDYRFLNDKHELTIGLQQFLGSFSREESHAFERAFGYHSFMWHHCVLSLAKSPKILSQWRGYAADGTGVALGFDSRALHYGDIQLVSCIYDEHEDYVRHIVERFDGFVAEVLDARMEFTAENDFMRWVETKHEKFGELVRALMALKNGAFHEEREVRAVRSVPRGQAKFRANSTLLIPYIDVPFWRKCEKQSAMMVVLREIWLGPKCNPLNRLALEALDLGLIAIDRYDCGYQ